MTEPANAPKAVESRTHKVAIARRVAYEAIVRLSISQPWLQAKESQLQALFSECASESEFNLVVDLLSRFHFLEAEDLEAAFSAIVEKVSVDWKLNQETTQFVALTYDDAADSGQWMVHALKPYLARIGWRKCKLVNRVPKASRYAETFHDVVLVDEFAGTGATVENQVNWLRKEFEAHKTHAQIRVCLMCAMETACERIESLGVELFVVHRLRRGISDHYVSDQLASAVADMLNLEVGLAPHVDGVPLPSFGYERAEALYCGDGNNTPNSVFPLFWWPDAITGDRRDTVLLRWNP